MDLNISKISLSTLHFEQFWPLALILFCALFLLFEFFPGRSYFYSIHSLRKFIDKHLIKHLLQGNENRKKSMLRTLMVGVIWALLAITLANPRWDFEETKALKPTVNLVVLLDISKSMDSADLKPSRLKRAKQEIADIIKKIDGVNIGVVAFAERSHIISPVTDDKSAIQSLLPSISTSLVGSQGSNIEAGLNSADTLLKPMEGGVNYIIVMSDGGFENANIKDLAKEVKNGKIITYGFGTEAGAPISDEGGKFIKDGEKMVITKLEKQNLINLSGLDNYIESSYLDDDSTKVAKTISADVGRLMSKAKIFKIWQDRFYIPLILAMALMLPFFRKGAIFPAIILMLFATPSFAKPFSIPKNQVEETEEPDDRPFLQKINSAFFKNYDQQGKEAFNNKKYRKAEEKFSNPHNKGVAVYRDGDIDAAEKYFSQAALENVDSAYNLGNIQLLQGRAEDAIKTYEEVLKRKPDHEDAKFNLAIAKRIKVNQPKNARPQPKKQEAPQQNEPLNQPVAISEKDGNSSKKQLDIEAKAILGKINSDPSELIKSRFRYEEKISSGDKKTDKNSKPW